MAGLPWVRLDADFAQHPKTLHLVAQGRWRAVTVYLCALAYSGRMGTDGYIPHAALPFIHGTRRDADHLIDAGLWHKADIGGGWLINDWADYQPLHGYRDSYSIKARKGNCIRWHGHACGCWKTSPSDRPAISPSDSNGTERN